MSNGNGPNGEWAMILDSADDRDIFYGTISEHPLAKYHQC